MIWKAHVASAEYPFMQKCGSAAMLAHPLYWRGPMDDGSSSRDVARANMGANANRDTEF